MGILRSGIFGGFSNKTGANIGRIVNGVNVVTGLHHRRTSPRAASEEQNSRKFALLMNYLSLMNPLIAIGFRQFTKNNKPLNAAYKFNFPTAFEGEAEILSINYPAIVYSKGNACRPSCLTLTPAVNSVVFEWATESQTCYSRKNDKATFLIFNTEKGFFLARQAAALRQDLSYGFALPPDFAGDELHCYMNFNSADGKLTGESTYAGAIVLAG